MIETAFSSKKIKRLWLFIGTAFLEGLLTLIVLFVIPGEKGLGFLLGYSKARLLMIFGMLVITAILAIFAIALRSRPKFLNFLFSRLERFPDLVWWSLLALFALFFLLTSFLLLQWLFVATDAFLSAYLQRLTPLLVFGWLFCLQGIGFAREWFHGEKAIWIFRLIVLGLVTLLPWLLIGEYFLADDAFPNYYVAERYLAAFRIVFALGIFISALYGQFLLHVLQKRLRVKMPVGLLVTLLFAVVGYYYFDAAIHHAELVNDDPAHSDQSAYMEFAKTAYETNFSYTGVRNQMPLYPYLQALFYRPGMSNPAFFDQGKRVNIILSLALLGVLFSVFRNYLSLHRATVLTLIGTVGLFIFKAGYFTSELLFYSLSFLSFLGMGLMLLKPSLILGLLTGLTLGVTYLTKATILPAVAAFAFVFLVKEVWLLFRDKRVSRVQRQKKKRIQHLTSFSFLLISFLILLSPYLVESKQKYGRYFYNVNSTFYIWYDSWAEAIADTAQYGYRQHWPDLPADQIPNWRNYLREHSLDEIKTRFVNGLDKQTYYLTHSYNAVNYIYIYGLVALLMTLGGGMKNIVRVIKAYFHLLLFVLLNFFGYLLLFAWYFPIAGGPRFLYGLFLPSAFFSFVATAKLFADLRSKKKLFGISWLGVVDAVMLATLFVDFAYVITFKLPYGYFGS